MFKKLLTKAKQGVVDKLLDKQLKQLPPDQREMVKKMVLEHPELFEKIAKETKELQKSGVPQQQAAMKVMMKYKNDLQKAMGGPQAVRMPGAKK